VGEVVSAAPVEQLLDADDYAVLAEEEGGHVHVDEMGLAHRCYHVCRSWLTPGFLAGWIVANTVTFPAEHVQWDHIWPFYYVGDWLDRTGHLQMWISYVWFACFLVFVVVGVRYVARQARH
jgi:hypothetical protein